MIFKVKIAVFFILTGIFAFGQNTAQTENAVAYKHSIGSSFFMLGNFLSDSPEYYLLTYGNRLTKKDRVFVEFNTWKYSEPLGTYGDSEELYPGFVRATGIGVGYQRFHWKGVFTTIQATSFKKQYHDINDNKTQKGFQLYLQLIAGYRFEFFKNRFYLEPAYALKYWPIDTNYPDDFAVIESGKPNYIFEPSLNFGFKF
ncbi:hypothetical protein FPF71_13055 [Algibacter amylolyticus]|uniref:DUF3575 domain-containing protein n=1 Tax=Algibacter amylolyticus TaxID=1608400 RepID=A0A5M7B8D0_9FLAO|nr:hypothetical protein [Algibacter amylolyticus]KAA5823625.1 hypothetical protein F2B50_13055 [Algibacter amylolyticus]MBB5267784.1 hypothetical protein [Algibacter amylolyticus]TSJ74113.1 hypothetical protein FPF71_13055 [Algibacter amylolyticus]